MSRAAPDIPIIPAMPSYPELEQLTDRRSDVEAKQRLIAELLRKHDCDGLLMLGEESFSWFTGGGIARGVLDPADLPVLYVKEDQRWVFCCNADSQRLFDEEIPGLGFQLKEWPWYWGRDPLLADACHNRKIASDRPYLGAKLLSGELAQLRLSLTTYEQASAKALGSILSHAIEATCRTMPKGGTEREIGGEVAHRLMHRGALPVHIEVAADGRGDQYRRGGTGATAMSQYATIRATAKKYGLHCTAARTVCFGEPPPQLRQDHDAACKVAATYMASTWPDGIPSEILGAARRVYQLMQHEHDWRRSPQGYVTGRLPVEQMFLGNLPDLLYAGWIVTWQPSCGAGLSCDTFLVTDQGPVLFTPPEIWPLKKIRLQGTELHRPDVLIRT